MATETEIGVKLMGITETYGTFSLSTGNYVHQPFASKEKFLAHHVAEASLGNEKSEDIIRTHNTLSVHERNRQRQQEIEGRI
jgi:hypothetical protein